MHPLQCTIFSSSLFKFSPGHRIRLSNFIRKVKTSCQNKNDVKVNRKRKMESQFEKVNKQRKTTEKKSTSDDESTVTLHTIVNVSKHVQCDFLSMCSVIYANGQKDKKKAY